MSLKKKNKTENCRVNRIGVSELEKILDRYNAAIPMKTIAKDLGLHESFVSGLVLGAKLAQPIRASYGFKEIALVPNKNVCESRLDADISSEVLRGVKLDVPLIAANMSAVCDASFCTALSNEGAMGILHRASPDDVLVAEASKLSKHTDVAAASIGVGDGQFDLARKLVDAGISIITIDIANGYTDAVVALGRQLKTELGVKVIIGNTTHPSIMYEVDGFADAVKVGIAQGLACETKNTAAFTEGQFSAVLKFKELSKKLGLPVISDGGIREPGDFVKAIAAGANSVMAGSIFARCPESAAETELIEGKVKKIYAGMASRYVQDKWKGGLKRGTCPEGKVVYLDLGENVHDLVERYAGALRSGITYGGARTIEELQRKAEFIRVTESYMN